RGDPRPQRDGRLTDPGRPRERRCRLPGSGGRARRQPDYLPQAGGPAAVLRRHRAGADRARIGGGAARRTIDIFRRVTMNDLATEEKLEAASSATQRPRTTRNLEQWSRRPALPETHYVDTRVYTDHEIFQEEIEKIFNRV